VKFEEFLDIEICTCCSAIEMILMGSGCMDVKDLLDECQQSSWLLELSKRQCDHFVSISIPEPYRCREKDAEWNDAMA
jgi:hypothetical protein